MSSPLVQFPELFRPAPHKLKWDEFRRTNEDPFTREDIAAALYVVERRFNRATARRIMEELAGVGTVAYVSPQKFAHVYAACAALLVAQKESA